MACPGCAQPMVRHACTRKPTGMVDVDLCFTCRVIWFDSYESPQLAPDAVIALFGQVQGRRDDAPRPLRGTLACPRCRQPLVLTHDLQRTNRFTYFRCTQDHGRLTPFAQFLREKNFVRSLGVGEIHTLRARLSQIRCTSCGAPVSIERDAKCAYCSAPLAILDADAVKQTLAELDAAITRTH